MFLNLPTKDSRMEERALRGQRWCVGSPNTTQSDLQADLLPRCLDKIPSTGADSARSVHGVPAVQRPHPVCPAVVAHPDPAAVETGVRAEPASLSQARGQDALPLAAHQFLGGWASPCGRALLLSLQGRRVPGVVTRLHSPLTGWL